MSEARVEIEVLEVPIAEILLDPNSYRLIDDPLWEPVPDEEIAEPDWQVMAFDAVNTEFRENISSLRRSMMQHGWLDIEPVWVRRLASGRLVIVDGNRRLVAWRGWFERPGTQLQLPLPGLPTGKIKVHLVPADRAGTGSLLHGLRHVVSRSPWPAMGVATWSERYFMDQDRWPWPLSRRPSWGRSGPGAEVLALRLARRFKLGPLGGRYNPRIYELLVEALRNPRIFLWLGANGDELDPARLDRFFSWLVPHEDAVADESEDAGEWEEHGTQGRVAILSASSLRRLSVVLNEPSVLARLDDGIPIEEIVSERQGVVLIDEPDLHLHPAVFDRVRRNIPIDPARAQAAILQLREALLRQRETPVEAGTDFPWELLRPGQVVALRNLSLGRFRGLADVNLSDLGRINLLVGVNNAGKTSVLEALYLLCHLSDPRGLLDTLQTRTRQDPERNPALLSHLVAALQVDVAAELDDGARVTLGLSRPPPPEGVDLATHIPGLRLDATVGEVHHATETQLFSNRPRRTLQAEGRNLWLAPVVLHSPFASQDRMAVVRWYEASADQESLDAILTTLREAIDPDIKNIRLVNESGRFLVEHQHREPMDLSSYGEGLQRIFEIGLLFAAHKGGLVLIDELETAIHTSALIRFTRMIQELAVRFDVQVFVTTHSKETIDAFLLNEYRTEDVVAYGLYREVGGIDVTRYFGPDLASAVNAINLDIRRP